MAQGPTALIAASSAGDLFQPARSVADAVLYEGYVLYPYRRSSAKNRVRWQFGVIAPRRWVEANVAPGAGCSGAAESWYQRAELLVQGGDATEIHVRVRFLQQQAKTVEESTAEGWRPVGMLDVDGRRHLSFDEAVPAEVDVALTLGDALHGGVQRSAIVEGGGEVEQLLDGDGRIPGRIVRSRCRLQLRIRVEVTPVDAAHGLVRLRVRTEHADDDAAGADAPRHEALRHSLIAAHTLMGVRGGAFISLLDPPAWAGDASRECVNEHVFPVLAGEPGSDGLALAAPIILYDHAQVAPESPGDLFDATEIDEILSLRTRTLTEEEKREARATDPRAAAIVERVDAMPDEVLARLHGVVRSMRAADGRGR